MKVTLMQHTPEPEKVVASAAKLCYSPVGVTEILEKLEDGKASEFVRMLMRLGHMSPVEHVSFTFGIEGISRVCSHQLVRHRIASYSQQSQRYVKLDAFETVVPPAIRENPRALAVFNETMETCRTAYGRIADLLLEAYMEEAAVEDRAARSAAEKKAIEDARFVFPNACETKIVVTMNARSLLHFFEQRCCNRAQWEIRAVADEMLRCVRQAAPTLFEQAGPPCVKGPCPEGAMSCGRAEEMRKKYKVRT